MSNITIIKVKQLLDDLLQWVTDDYQKYQSSEQDSWLYSIFGGEKLGSFDLFTQAKELILRTSRSSRKLETRLMFDQTRANLPTIHIHLPSESPGGMNGLQGGFAEEIELPTSYIDGFVKSFKSQYDFIVTSNNSFETILIYELLKRLLIAATDTLAVLFLTYEISGKELIVQNDLIPNNLYFRTISIFVDDNIEVQSINRDQKYSSDQLNFTGQIKN